MTRMLIIGFVALACGAACSQDADLFPFVIPWDDDAPSVANVSEWNEKPAGKSGFITVSDGHFVDGNGERIRFLGTNLCFASAFPPHDVAEKVARRMAKFGINVVRFHHMDNAYFPRGIWDGEYEDKQHLSAEAIDRLDYMIFQLKENGIYANINLHVSRTLAEADGIQQASEMPKYGKGVDNFHPEMIRLQRNYARDLLTHVNEYTGNAYTDEQAVAAIEINNENSLTAQWRGGAIDTCPEYIQEMLDERWNEWLSAKYAGTPALQQAWDTEAEPLNDVEMLANSDFSVGTDNWTAQTAGTSEATLEVTDDGPDGSPALKLTVTETSDTSWHAQLYQAGLAFEEGKAYTLAFKARAEPTRRVGINSFRAKEPWGVLGFSANIEAGDEWTTHEFAFRATETEDVARITFTGLGLQEGALWIAEPSLRLGGIAGLPAGETLEAGNVTRPSHGTITGRSANGARDYVEFLLAVETEYWTGMVDYLKGDLGVKQPITGTQMGYTPPQTHAAMDYYDVHAYWHHPSFPGKPWDANNWFVANRPMTDSEGGTLPRLAARRVAGKPYTVSEYNHPAPNAYGSEAMLLLSAFAGLQDWDGIYQFTYNSGDWWEADRLDSYFNIKAHAAQLVTLPAAAALFRRGDIQPARQATLVRTTPEEIIDMGTRDPAAGAYATAHGVESATSLSHRVAIAVGDDAEVAGPTTPLGNAQDGWRADTGELLWSYSERDSGVVTIDTSNVVARIGATADAWQSDSGVGITIGATRHNWAAITIAAIDGDGVGGPGRHLITATGHYANSGWGWEADGDRVTLGRDWGEAPYVAEGIPATITLPVPAARLSAHALDASGARAGELAVTGGDRATIAIGPEHQTLWYEVVVD
ncbi:MAG TPA: carbohydrate binding domain-containing protein [Armatimonadota bacterium]|nr:carbohydrate binding domain-containing protein [Armatimonadota bacterium]